jgi:hypothetical protein
LQPFSNICLEWACQRSVYAHLDWRAWKIACSWQVTSRSLIRLCGYAMLSRPVITMIAIALGLPFLILFVITASNPNISSGIVSIIVGGSIIMSFVVMFIFEIKRLADQPSDPH